MATGEGVADEAAHVHRGPRREVEGWSRAAAEAAIIDVYGLAGLSAPCRFVWATGPVEMAAAWSASLGRRGANLMKALLGAGNRVETVRAHGPRVSGPHTVERAIAAAAAATLGSRPFAAFLGRRRLRGFARSGIGPCGEAHRLLSTSPDRLARQTKVLAAVLRMVGWIIPCQHVCWVAEPCRRIHVDDLGRLHNPKGAAIEFADGWTVHAWKGVVVPGWTIESPGRLTTALVDTPYDAWVRRCMIEMLTPERFIREGGADCFSSDETGRLWRRRWWNATDNSSDAWAAVEVLNGTLEPDGTRKRYFLQVPPEVRSAREGVAWTYGLSEQQYAALTMRT